MKRTVWPIPGMAVSEFAPLLREAIYMAANSIPNVVLLRDLAF